LIAVVAMAVAAVAATLAQVRCVDAAREAARLAARGDTAAAVPAAEAVGPPGLSVQVDRAGTTVTVRVHAPTPLPGLTVSAVAVAAVETGEG
jgi:hypothetical protein